MPEPSVPGGDTPIGLPPGAAHAKAIALDALVLVGLYVVAQRPKSS